MSIALNFDLRSLNAVAKNLEQVGELDQDRMLDVVGAEVETQTRRRLSEEKTAPDGSPWPELSEPYRTKKSEKSSGDLMVAGELLLQSIGHEAESGAVAIGSNLIYARRHDQGDDGGPIPQRQYLGLSSENEADLNAITSDFIEHHLNQL